MVEIRRNGQQPFPTGGNPPDKKVKMNERTQQVVENSRSDRKSPRGKPAFAATRRIRFRIALK
jgi:hypothetical protein